MSVKNLLGGMSVYKKNEEIGVSICCSVYNHEKYLRKCLDGFIQQQTNFKIEVLIHDDASTDHSRGIIEEYVGKYPNIFKPIYQSENQYSKGVKISWAFQYPRAKGKYIALCEGDDYWCDEYKLQKQFEWMENNPDCTLCVHEARKHNCYTGEDTLYTKCDVDREFLIEEILEEGAIFATNSCFIRTLNQVQMPELFQAKGFGDHQIIIHNTLCGYCYYFADVMSVYNWGTEESWTTRVFFDKKKRVAHCKEMIALMKRIDKYTNYKYNLAIQKKICKTEFNMHLVHGDFITIHRKKYKDLRKNSEGITWNPTKECIVNRFPWLLKLRRKNYE